MRTKRGYVRRRRVNRVLDAARGYVGGRSKLFKTAKEAVRRAWWYARAHRRRNKSNFRSLWITRISAASRMRGVSYSHFMAGLRKADIQLNRKVLANLALTDTQAFDELIKKAAQAV